MGTHCGRPDRHVDHVRSLHRALPGRRAEDPDSELYEAARVDGAGFLREFFAVTLPGLRNELVVAATLTTITALRNFDIIYNTTSGGPGGETEVPSWVMFHNAFDLSRVGFAASIAVVLTVIITAVALVIGGFEANGVTARLDRYTTYVVLDRVLAARDLSDDLDPLPGACTRSWTW